VGMNRREMIRAGLAASAVALAERGARPESSGMAGLKVSHDRQYYELRKYLLRRDKQVQTTAKYLSDALIPALNKMGIGPVGAFSVDIGPETPTIYLLLPSVELETLVNAGLYLREDQTFLSAAEPFWDAPDTSPAFERVENTLFIAFEKWPQLVLPPPTATKGKRVFQMRSYESASDRDHVRKVEMFQSGEFEAFDRAGFWRVFFGDALIGERLPGPRAHERDVGHVPQRCGMEEAAGRSAVQLRPAGGEHYEPCVESDGLFAGVRMTASSMSVRSAKQAAPPSAGYSGTPLWKKLGVKDGQLTWRLKMPASVAAEIAAGGAAPKMVKTPKAGLEMAHVFVTKRQEMGSELEWLRGVLAQDGTVWVSWPKKTVPKNVAAIATDITEDTVREVCLPMGFVDVKVCAVDAVWSGLKLVIRKTERK